MSQNNFNCIGPSEKTYHIGTTKIKLLQELNTGISSNSLKNTQLLIADW